MGKRYRSAFAMASGFSVATPAASMQSRKASASGANQAKRGTATAAAKVSDDLRAETPRAEAA